MKVLKWENDNAYIEHRSDYLYLQFMDNCSIELDDAKILSAAVIDLCNGKACPFITDVLGKTIRISNDARDYFAKYPPLIKMRKSHAILVNNISSRLLANFFIKFHKPSEDTRIFSNLEDAFAWLGLAPS